MNNNLFKIAIFFNPNPLFYENIPKESNKSLTAQNHFSDTMKKMILGSFAKIYIEREVDLNN